MGVGSGAPLPRLLAPDAPPNGGLLGNEVSL